MPYRYNKLDKNQFNDECLVIFKVCYTVINQLYLIWLNEVKENGSHDQCTVELLELYFRVLFRNIFLGSRPLICDPLSTFSTRLLIAKYRLPNLSDGDVTGVAPGKTF